MVFSQFTTNFDCFFSVYHQFWWFCLSFIPLPLWMLKYFFLQVLFFCIVTLLWPNSGFWCWCFSNFTHNSKILDSKRRRMEWMVLVGVNLGMWLLPNFKRKSQQICKTGFSLAICCRFEIKVEFETYKKIRYFSCHSWWKSRTWFEKSSLNEVLGFRVCRKQSILPSFVSQQKKRLWMIGSPDLPKSRSTKILIWESCI